jgi:hypothetical protein
VSAEHHWTALHRAFSDVLSKAQVAHAHERFARRAAALSDIYLPRIASMLRHAAGDRSDLTREVLELEGTHRALTAALAAAGNGEGEGEDVGTAMGVETRYKTAVDVPHAAHRPRRL